MKKALSYLVLFAYGTIMLMPVLPYVSDKVAHTFWLYEHISTVHYERGQYHTHYQEVEIAKKTGTEHSNSNSKNSGFADEHTTTSVAYRYTLPTIISTYFSNYNLSEIHVFLLSDYPPPKA